MVFKIHSILNSQNQDEQFSTCTFISTSRYLHLQNQSKEYSLLNIKNK